MHNLKDKLLFEIDSLQVLSKLKGITSNEIKDLPTMRLLDYHRKTHMFYASAIKRDPIKKQQVNEIVTLHNKLVKEMKKRKIQHSTPLKKI